MITIVNLTQTLIKFTNYQLINIYIHVSSSSTSRSTSCRWWSKDRLEILSRKDAVLLAQPCSGHSKLLLAYRHIIHSTDDPLCPKCDEDKHTVEHWFTSRLTLLLTHLELFGSVDVSMNLLSLQYAEVHHASKEVVMGFFGVCASIQ